MSKHRKAGASTLFLTELMIAVLVFAAASAICLQIFAKAHSLTRKSTGLTGGVTACSSVAELFSSASDFDDGVSLFENVFPEAVEVSTEECEATLTDYAVQMPEGTDQTIYYLYRNSDDDAVPSDDPDACYLQVIVLSEDNYDLSCTQYYLDTKSGECSYTLSFIYHFGRKAL